MTEPIATNAASSNIQLDKKVLKSIATRTDKYGLLYILKWTVALCFTGFLVWVSIDTYWIWPAMFIHGVVLTVPAYSFSHETAHGTAFRTSWLNETVLWVTSFLYLEEPLHRRYTHTNHHTHTWYVGLDSQMPFDTPMKFGEWVTQNIGWDLLRFHVTVFWQLATRKYTEVMRSVTPESELPKMTRNARIMLAVYALIGFLPFIGIWWPVWFLILPRLLGAPVMLLFTLIQHVELQENSPSILESTRSFRTSWLGRFLYMNMNNHVEHHLYPQVPFHSLPKLAEAVKDQLPEPDPGFFSTNWQVFVVVLRRSLGLSTKAASIRQAPHMISEGGQVERIARRTM